jgi:hypothetical protein
MVSTSGFLNGYTIEQLEEALAEKKRKREETQSTDPSNRNEPGSGGRATKRGRKEPPPAIYKASIDSLAETIPAAGTSSTANADLKVIKQTQKVLNHAKHSSSTQREMEAALAIASRLMQQHDVSQTSLLAHRTDSEQQEHGGCSIVSVHRIDGDKSKNV